MQHSHSRHGHVRRSHVRRSHVRRGPLGRACGRHLAGTALAASLLVPVLGVAPAMALDLGGPDLRGAVETGATDPWAMLADLDVEAEFADADDQLDMLAREEAGVPLEEPEPRSSVRTADPVTVSQNLTGPARAPDWEPTPPTTVSTSVAIYPRETWGGGRPSVTLLGY